ncbi:hypothetical protein EMIHUDRAFT_458032, partial [Emiliania huxleyi CCMP1516]|uniref:RRM domain-containing protein n=2 Tax=Emiliania huxleyi TaxID=2903 RepID=A0A0D3JIM6_EMIH1
MAQADDGLSAVLAEEEPASDLFEEEFEEDDDEEDENSRHRRHRDREALRCLVGLLPGFEDCHLVGRDGIGFVRFASADEAKAACSLLSAFVVDPAAEPPRPLMAEVARRELESRVPRPRSRDTLCIRGFDPAAGGGWVRELLQRSCVGLGSVNFVSAGGGHARAGVAFALFRSPADAARAIPFLR